MDVNVLVVDNFYQDPLSVREFALSQDFNVTGNYPGLRTKSFLDDELKYYINEIVSPHAGNVVYWADEGEDTYTGAFQIATSADRTWIHADQTTGWAAVCYLTPDAPVSGGTGLFRHKETGMYKSPRDENGERVEYDHELMEPLNNDFQDYTKWEQVDTIGNVFNRLVLYRGDIFHASLDYFGHDMETGRLFQTFFFSTEY
jgi:hypothetical protein